MNRLEYLLQLHQEQPEDPFLLYGIALEYQKSESPETSSVFDQLLTTFPSYLPTYYQAAAYFSEGGLHEKALTIYTIGIELAQQQNELKTLAELKNAKQNLEIDLM
ncbi:MAG: hypothetical protein H7259_04845 [Cytophagales bacterium]|nr:hypothetical protein [Cytophaga sp.]